VNRIAYLDGLRAVAVLMVVLYHAAQANPYGPPGKLLDLLTRQGCHGVELFFVISGFCLSYPTLLRLRAAGAGATFDVGRFAVRRIVRIVPPYYCAIGALLVMALILERVHVAFPPFMDSGSAGLPQLLKQLAFSDAHARFLNASFWTLPVELRWYAVFPAALWVWTRSPRGFFVVMLAAVMAFLTRAATVDVLVLPAFMLGIVAADMHIRAHRFARFAAVLFVPVSAVALAQTPQHAWGFISPFSEAAAFLFVVAAGRIHVVTRVLSIKPLASIGTASYSIYLIHAPVIGLLETHGVWIPLAAAAGVAAGIAFWWIAERPFVETALRDRLVTEISFIPKWLKLAGVGTDLQLRVPPAPQDARAAA
jgi:peptidoglycan/LPS O-acetylase OafA/YrhL